MSAIIAREVDLDGVPAAMRPWVEALIDPLKRHMRDVEVVLDGCVDDANRALELLTVTVTAGQTYPLTVSCRTATRPRAVTIIGVESPAGTAAALTAAPWLRWGFAPNVLTVIERPLGLSSTVAYSVTVELRQ